MIITPDGRAVLVDWAWSAAAAPWLDPDLGCIWLIATGKRHPADAERWASRKPAWRAATPDALDAFAEANAGLWADIAGENPGPWANSPRDAARRRPALRDVSRRDELIHRHERPPVAARRRPPIGTAPPRWVLPRAGRLGR
ncbi:hypothetical protein [Streptomyces sp. NPDC058612]|uniref:hypothetical protein n=1 Tax=Streptomyces sp. NPDC058612 TaxID=3346555 RepID=UPI00365C38B6